MHGMQPLSTIRHCGVLLCLLCMACCLCQASGAVVCYSTGSGLSCLCYSQHCTCLTAPKSSLKFSLLHMLQSSAAGPVHAHARIHVSIEMHVSQGQFTLNVKHQTWCIHASVHCCALFSFTKQVHTGGFKGCGVPSGAIFDTVIEDQVDHVRAYFGMRKISLGRIANEKALRPLLNDKFVFHMGMLDQVALLLHSCIWRSLGIAPSLTLHVGCNPSAIQMCMMISRGRITTRRSDTIT